MFHRLSGSINKSVLMSTYNMKYENCPLILTSEQVKITNTLRHIQLWGERSVYFEFGKCPTFSANVSYTIDALWCAADLSIYRNRSWDWFLYDVLQLCLHLIVLCVSVKDKIGKKDLFSDFVWLNVHYIRKQPTSLMLLGFFLCVSEWRRY